MSDDRQIDEIVMQIAAKDVRKIVLDVAGAHSAWLQEYKLSEGDELLLSWEDDGRTLKVRINRKGEVI